MELNQIVSLLGKSERDEQVKAMLASLGVEKPLPRPKRGDYKIYVELQDSWRMDFIFYTIETCRDEHPEFFEGDFLEGELIFWTVFFRPNEIDFRQNILLPFGVGLQETREEHFKVLGKPEWENSEWFKYRWNVNGMFLFITYNEQGKIEVFTCQFLI
jgi:hypothetical protein